MAGPGMPTAAPYDHQPTFPTAYPQPPLTSYIPSNTTYAGDNGYLAPPPMGPRPQTTATTYVASPHSGTYDYSRPSTPYSQMTTTAVGSEHSHGELLPQRSVPLGLTYCLDVGFMPQPRAQSSNPQATHGGGSRPTKPPTGKPSTKPKPKPKGRGQPGDSHGPGCCIIM